MKEVIFILFLLIASVNLSCKNAFLAQNEASPTITPNDSYKQSINKEEARKHYWEGLRIKDNYDIPDNTLKAIEEFKKSAEFDPKDTMPYWQMIPLYARLKEYDEVESCYRKIMEIDSNNLGAQWGLAYVLVWNLDKYEEGLKEALIAKDKKATDSFIIEETIGKAYEGLGDTQNAIKHYKIYLKDLRDLDSSDSTLYKEMKKKITEMEKLTKNSNSNQ